MDKPVSSRILTPPQGPDQGQEKTTCFPGLRQGLGRVEDMAQTPASFLRVQANLQQF